MRAIAATSPKAKAVNKGDPLAPALYALGQHEALLKAASAVHASDSLLAFLDDLYVLTTRERARAARDTVVGIVEAECGIASNEGKTKVYSSAGGPPPPGVAELGSDVWRGDKPLKEARAGCAGHPHRPPALHSSVGGAANEDREGTAAPAPVASRSAVRVGSSSRCVPHREPTTRCAPCPRKPWRLMPTHVTRRYGRRWSFA